MLADHHTLRRPRRAGRVDQRGKVIGIGGLGERLQVRPAGAQQDVVGRHVVGRLVGGWVDDEDPTQPGKLGSHLQEPLEEPAVLNDRDLRLGVVDEVLQLLGRRRVVDGDRRRPQERGREVGDMELGSVAHHQHHALARPQTAACSPAATAATWSRSSRYVVSSHPSATDAPQGDHSRVRRHRPQERLRQRVPRYHRVDLGRLGGVIANTHGKDSLRAPAPDILAPQSPTRSKSRQHTRSANRPQHRNTEYQLRTTVTPAIP